MEALRKFAAENPSDEDTPLRIDLEAWALLLQISGPPSDGEFNPFRGTWEADIPGLSVRVEYLVLPYLADPAIVVREYRRS